MTPARWHQIENLYFSVVERPAHERADFLRDSANDDSDLRREVESLIAAHDRADDFLPESELFAIGCELLAERSRALRRGQRFGSYKILNFIGSGGMGEVYHAADERSDRCVALKLLPRSFSQDPERVARFRREARAASRVVHENIARIYDVGTFENLDFIALEYIEGKTLRQRLKNGALSETEVLIFAEQIAKALAAAHAAGIVHRDLKPENIMITSDGQVKIVDFSIAKFDRKSSARQNSRETDFDLNETNPLETAAEKIVGTPGYMSPEQLRGHEIDNRTDIWNFGVLLYEMLIGKPPFRGATSVDVIAAVLTIEPAFSDKIKISSELRRIIGKTLSKEPARRYQTADEILNDLKTLSEQEQITGQTDRASRWKLFTAAAVFAIFVAGGIWLTGFKMFSESVSPQEIKQTVCTQTNGLISWYAAEGSAADELNLNNGILENGATFAHGKFGQGFKFDGEDDFLRATTRNFPIGDADRTIEGWVKIDKFWNDFYTETFFFGYGNFNDQLSMTFHLGAVDDDKNRNQLFFSQWGSGLTGDSLKNDTFYHIAATNTGNEANLYLNGELIRTKTVALNLGQDAEFFIGRIGNELGDYRRLNGIADEVKIYNRALSAAEIQAIYNNGDGVDCREEKIVQNADLPPNQVLPEKYRENTPAYRAYLKGQFHAERETEEEMVKASEYYREAIRLDPNFAPAYVGLSHLYRENFGEAQFMTVGERIDKARSLTLKALELDETLAVAHVQLASILTNYDWDWTEAEKQYRRAIELNPKLAKAYHGYAYYLAFMGRSDESIAAIRRAEEIDPVSTRIARDIGVMYFFARQYEEAVEHYKKAFKLDREKLSFHMNVGGAYQCQKKYAEAINEYLTAIRLDPNYLDAYSSLGQTYALAGQREKALEILSKMERRAAGRKIWTYYKIKIYAGLGDNDRAFEWLEKGMEDRSIGVRLKVDPHLDNLRSDPRFDALLRRAGFSDYVDLF